MPEARHRLGLAGESRALRRPGISPGAYHLDGDRAVELLVAGPVHDAHAAGAEDGLRLVAGDLREVAARPRARRADAVRRRAGLGEDVIEQGLDPAEPLPALADVRKEFRVIRAGGLGRHARLQGVLDQFPDAKVIGHPSASSPLAPDLARPGPVNRPATRRSRRRRAAGRPGPPPTPTRPHSGGAAPSSRRRRGARPPRHASGPGP